MLLVCLLLLQVGMEMGMSVAQLQVVLLSFNKKAPLLSLSIALMSSTLEFLRKSLWLLRNAWLVRSSIFSLVSLYVHVPWNDAFRIGPKKQPVDSPEGSREDRCPRLLLVKVSSEWGWRILLSSRYKLKGYVAAKVFLQEDLIPLDVRQDCAKKVQRTSKQSTPTIWQWLWCCTW